MTIERVVAPERVEKKTVDKDGRIYVGRNHSGEDAYIIVAESLRLIVDVEGPGGLNDDE